MWTRATYVFEPTSPQNTTAEARHAAFANCFLAGIGSERGSCPRWDSPPTPESAPILAPGRAAAGGTGRPDDEPVATAGTLG